MFHGNRVFNQRIQTYKEGGVEFGDIITGITTVRAICHLPNKQLKLSRSSLSPHGSPSPSVLSANSTIYADSSNPGSSNPGSLIDRMREYLTYVGEKTAEQEATFQSHLQKLNSVPPQKLEPVCRKLFV